MKLDVGCGSSPKGSANCDIEKQKVASFVQCDAQYLPFRDCAFSTVYSGHTVEHVNNSRLMVKELLRVSNGKVIIRTPHLFSYASRGLPMFSKFTGFTYHIHAWTRGYWKHLFANFKCKITIKPCLTTAFWWIPLKSIEIVVEVQK